MATFICQQCKQPLQLDPSLTDLPQSAYDMVGASLPKQPSTDSRSSALTLEQQLSRLDIPDDAKSAIQTHKAASHSRMASSPKSIPMRISAAPAESFVLLKDSVVNTIPSTPPPTGKRPPIPPNSAGNRRQASISTPAAKGSPQPNTPRSASSQNGTPTMRPKRPSISTTSTPSQRSTSRSTASPEPQTPNSAIRKPEAPPPRAPPHKSSAQRLFSSLSSRTEIDHPLCAECTHLMLESLHRKLEETKKERDGYIAFEREVKKQKDAAAAEGGNAEKEALKRIEKLKAEEVEAINELRAAEREQAQLDEELAQLEREEKELEEEEAEFWTAYSSTSMAAAKLQDTLTSLEHAHAANSLELSKLSRTNVYNDAFCIGHDGVFGTINGLRLGRVPNVPVEWSEINAAWGMTVLLLNTIARKVGFSFESWKLVPMGSFSKIERIGGDKASYELYGSGDMHIGRFLHNRRFDNAMVAFLDCLRQLMEYARSQDPQVEFPQQVSKDKIGEASIKFQFGQDEAWTRALRHVLLALKLLLKWATNG